MNTPKVIDSVVKNDMCIGCGLCVYSCPSNALSMVMNNHGFLIPELTGECDSNGNCLDVCPFNPTPEKEVRTENELGELFLSDVPKHHPKIGRYSSIYAGYSNEFRLTSSSGGIGTFILTELFSKGVVNHVISVKGSQGNDSHYVYSISSSKEELLQTSKTKYYPVTLAEAMSQINSLDGKVAIVGVACFIKSIRLAQHYEPILKDKIPFLVGIICGGVKSSFFTEYLASKAGIDKQDIKSPKFRIKDFDSTADDYSYGAIDKSVNKQKVIKMATVGDMWGSGLFKNNACDFCDDVTTELADISLGDAWLEPYNKDGHGTNVVVARSSLAKQLIENGIENGSLTLEKLPLDRFLASQQGSFNHRHLGLSVRKKEAEKRGQQVPPKRFDKESVTIDFRLVQKLRMKVRRKSLETWEKTPYAESFDSNMRKYLKQLRLATRVYHYKRAILRRLKP